MISTPPEGGFTATTNNNGDYTYLGLGTSFAAAPMVSGAMALLAQKFPYLTGSQIQDILFASATNLGDVRVDEIFGHSMLDIGVAMAPIVTLTIPTGGSSSSVSATSTGITSGVALNLSALSLSNVLILDDYDRGYNVDISAIKSENSYTYDPNRFNVMNIKDYLIGLNVFEQEFMVGYSFENFDLKFSKKDDVFGSKGTRATYLDCRTYYVTLTKSFSNFYTELTYGYSNPKAGGIFSGISEVQGIASNIYYKKDGFTFGVKTPMNVVSGKLDTKIPTSRTNDGQVLCDNYQVSLKGNQLYQCYFKYEISF